MTGMRAFRIAYDGRPYHGFQRQPDVPTVDGEILSALRALDSLDSETNTPPGYAAAGRTDAGVSAVAQTVAFQSPDWLTPIALNSELPDSIQVWASADAPADFHATHHAHSREYTYFLSAPEAETGTAQQAVEALSGEHDFHNLTPDETGTRRNLSATVQQEGELLVLRFVAGGFARQLVRRLASLVEEVVRGDSGQERIDRVLSPESLPGPVGIGPAPAHPLVLTDVEYPGLSFESDPEAVAMASELFEERRRAWTARAQVAETIVSGILPPEATPE